MKRHLRASTRRTRAVHALECKLALKNLLGKNCVWTDEHSSGHWAVFSAGRCRLRGWRVPSNTKALRAVSSSCPLTRSPDPPAAGATAESSGRGPLAVFRLMTKVEPIELLNRQISGVAALRILAT